MPVPDLSAHRASDHPGDHPGDHSGDGWAQLFVCSAALLGLLTVAMAALAAHLPDNRLFPGGRALLRTAVEMQGWHIVALLACGLLLQRCGGVGSRILLRASGGCFLLGIIGFCAGLYGLAFAGAAGLAHLAPLGGSVLMLGWVLLFASTALRSVWR